MNSQDFDVPSQATKYILLQRTETQWPLKKIRYWLPGGRSIYNAVYNYGLYELDAFLREDQIKDQYRDRMQTEYGIIKPYLPEEVASILDIGCGVGGMDLLLARHYQPRTPRIYLYDKTKLASSVYYQFQQDGYMFYNSLEVASRLMTENGINEQQFETRDANQFDLSRLSEVDLCISLLSWAFHYPLDTYMNQVLECLSSQGSLILDFRHDTGGFESCRTHFKDVEIIQDKEKYRRAIFHQPVREQVEPSTPEIKAPVTA